MGNGRFAATLSYADWYHFNNAQRAHYNLVESLPSVLGLHLLSGICFPKITAASSLLWLVSRYAWASNYSKDGPDARYRVLSSLHLLCIIGWLGGSVASGLRVAGFLKF